MRLPQGLPSIAGTRGRVLLAAYWLVALPTIVAVAFGLWFAVRDMSHNVPASMAYGLRTFTYGAAGHGIGAVTPEAARAGVRVGDRIVQVNGQALRRGASEFEIGDRLGDAGQRIVLGLVGQDGSARTAVLARNASSWTATDPSSGLPVWLYVIVELLSRECFPLVMIAASLLLVYRRRGDAETMLFAFALLMLCMRAGSLWWWSGSPVPREALQAWWVTGWLAAFLAIAGFPDGRFTSRTARGVVAVLVVLIACNLLLNLAATLGPARWIQLVGGLVSIAVIPAALASAVAVIQRYRSTPPGAERQQIKWVVGGSCITLLTLVMLILFEVAQTGRYTAGSPLAFLFFAFASFVSVVALPIGLIVSLLRFRLYDAEATISRSAVYAALTVSLLLVFAAGEKLVEAFGQQYFQGSLGTVAGGIGAALAAVMIAPLHHRLSAWSERRFQQGLLSLRNGLPVLVGDLRETASLDEIARTVLKRVEIGVRARHAALIVGESVEAARHIGAEEIASWRRGWVPRESAGLDCERDDPLFPMRVPLEAEGCGRIGWLLLGPRPDGSFFGKDEREALGDIAGPVARAIAIVRQREADHARFETRIGALEAAIAQLGGRAPA